MLHNSRKVECTNNVEAGCLRARDARIHIERRPQGRFYGRLEILRKKQLVNKVSGSDAGNKKRKTTHGGTKNEKIYNLKKLNGVLQWE